MSTLLEEYQKKVDSSNVDVRTVNGELRATINQFNEKMTEQTDTNGLKFIQLESDMHAITKSIADGLTPVMQQTRQTDDGKTIEVLWPDYTVYGKGELDYFEKRYNETANLFLKTEYGLLLFLKRRLQHDNDRTALCNNLIDLAKMYHSKIFSNDEGDNFYSHSFHNRLIDIMGIYIQSPNLNADFEAFIKLIENWLINCPVEHKGFITLSYFVTQSFSDNKKKLQSVIAVDNIIAKIEQSIQHYSTSNLHTAISLTEKAELFSNSFKPNDKAKFVLQLANFYEAAGDAEVQKDHAIGAIKDYEDALSNFHKLKDEVSIERVSKKYEANKGKFKLGTISVETSEKTATATGKFINGIVDKKSPALIIACLCGYNIIPRADGLKDMAKKQSASNSFLNHVTAQSLDKFGNTLRIYVTKEEHDFYNLMSVINLSHQFSVQIIHQILMRSLKAGFFSYENVKNALEDTWLNEPVEWMKYGDEHQVIPLAAILPGIKNFFEEMDRRIKDDTYIPNLTLCSDSMATKIEMILRYMSKNMGVPTFRYIEQGGVILTDEKPLSKLLEGVEGQIEEDDTILIKYLTNEKGGFNIRNGIAHGLVDANEYTPAIPITLLAIILRLSQYTFPQSKA